METILIANEKGGTAKTTTALFLANCLTALGYRVLAVDMDPSGNLSAAALPNFPDKVLYDVFRRTCTVHDAIVHTDICDVLPTVKDIDSTANLDDDFGDIPAERKSLGQLADSWVGRRNAEYMLQALLFSQKFALYDSYDFVIIDSAPSDNILVTNAIVAANSVLVPCEPTSASIDGLNMFIASVWACKRCYNTNVAFDGLLFTKYTEEWDTRRKRIEDIKTLARNRDLPVYRTKIRMSASAETSMNECRPILDYLYRGSGATDAMNFTLEFLAARGLSPKVSYPGVFEDEYGRLIFRKNGDKFYVVTQTENGPAVQEQYFRQDYIQDENWKAAVGKSIFLSMEALRRKYPRL